MDNAYDDPSGIRFPRQRPVDPLLSLPDHPSGLLELDEGLLKEVAGAATLTTYKTCTAYTSSQARGCCK